MSDHDRAPSTPRSEPPLAFDPRRPVRGAGPAPVTLIVSALVLIGLVVGIAFIYRGGVRRADQPPSPVGEPLTDIKTPAPPAAASDEATAGLTIYRTDSANAGAVANAAAPTLAPPPEQPTPVATTTATPLPPPPSTAVATAPPAPPPPAPPARAATKPDGALSLASIEDAASARAAGAKASHKPAASPSAAPAPAAPPPGVAWVQIGAVSSPDLADKAWSDVARLVPAAMLGKGKRVEPLTKDGRSLYRTYVTGFAGRDQAEAFCGKLRAAGKSCLVK
jgi:hypothetical protein